MTKKNQNTSTRDDHEAKAAGAEVPAACPSTSLLLTELLMPGLAGEPERSGSVLLPAPSPAGEAAATGESFLTAEIPDYSTSTALQAILRERTRDIMEALSRKADYLAEHSRRVGIFAAMVAEDLGFPRRKVEELQWVGSLHDAGKLAVSSEVLRKPGSLLPQEYEEIKAHPVYSQSLVAPLAALMGCSWASGAVRHHHERVDGRGYPDGLSGSEIPLEARIIAVCDSYDAMAACRPYQGSLSEARIRENLSNAAGSQLDERLVKVFLKELSSYRERMTTNV